MGLVKTNYSFKGYTLPTAYARVQVNTEKREATFFIGANRDLAFKEPIEKIKIYDIPFSHEKNPLVEAYEFAKGQREEYVYNQATGEEELVMVNQPFHDWQNDII